MPNLDGGHYFLTVLAPVNDAQPIRHDGMISSPVHMLRDALETLPTALQSPATEATGINSPFSRSRRTHFARFAVIDDVFFNGRDPADSIRTAALGPDPIVARPVDHLPCPYLLFAAEFDPAGDGAAEPRSYLEELWGLAADELRAVFRYCRGFGSEMNGAGFADFILARQIETTMPFNDYWVGAPPLPNQLWWLIAAVVGGAAAGGAGFWVFQTLHAPLWMVCAGSVMLFAAVGVALAYALVMALGRRPFPAAPNATLPHVLKALYLQQAFTRFASAHQAESPAELRGAFADFVAAHRPADLAGPTQPPGVVRTLGA